MSGRSLSWRGSSWEGPQAEQAQALRGAYDYGAARLDGGATVAYGVSELGRLSVRPHVGTPMYNGTLTREQVFTGRLKALQNAEELIRDARWLYWTRRWPRSYFLSQIAVEEAGKYFYLLSATVAVTAGRVRWPRFWKAVRSHSDKTTLFLMLEDILVPGPSSPKNLSEHKQDAKVLERGKMWSLYADYEQNDFFAPSEVIDRAMARAALALARNRVRLARRFEDSADHSELIRQLSPETLARVEEQMRELLAREDVEVAPVESDEA